jgi:hypothetical protein
MPLILISLVLLFFSQEQSQALSLFSSPKKELLAWANVLELREKIKESREEAIKQANKEPFQEKRKNIFQTQQLIEEKLTELNSKLRESTKVLRREKGLLEHKLNVLKTAAQKAEKKKKSAEKLARILKIIANIDKKTLNLLESLRDNLTDISSANQTGKTLKLKKLQREITDIERDLKRNEQEIIKATQTTEKEESYQAILTILKTLEEDLKTKNEEMGALLSTELSPSVSHGEESLKKLKQLLPKMNCSIIKGISDVSDAKMITCAVEKISKKTDILDHPNCKLLEIPTGTKKRTVSTTKDLNDYRSCIEGYLDLTPTISKVGPGEIPLKVDFSAFNKPQTGSLSALLFAAAQLEKIETLRNKIQAQKTGSINPLAGKYNILKKEYDSKNKEIETIKEKLKEPLEAEKKRIGWEITNLIILIKDTKAAIKESYDQDKAKKIIMMALAGNLKKELSKQGANLKKEVFNMAKQQANAFLSKLGLKPFEEAKSPKEMLLEWQEALSLKQNDYKKVQDFSTQLYRNPKFADYLVELVNRDIDEKTGFFSWLMGAGVQQKEKNKETIHNLIQQAIDLKKQVDEIHNQLSQTIGYTQTEQTKLIKGYSDESQALMSQTQVAIQKASCKTLKGLNDLNKEKIKACLIDQLSKIGFQKLSNINTCYTLRKIIPVGKNSKNTKILNEFDSSKSFEQVRSCADDFLKTANQKEKKK